jgi:hypothetical protein
MASVWPIPPPAVFEIVAQFVPNRNSIGIPLTTPTAKLMAKNTSPEGRRVVLRLIILRKSEDLENDNEQGQTQCQLWKQVMKCNRKGEVQPVYGKCRIHVNRYLPR